jgi:hypothetical protein
MIVEQFGQLGKYAEYKERQLLDRIYLNYIFQRRVLLENGKIYIQNHFHQQNLLMINLKWLCFHVFIG